MRILPRFAVVALAAGALAGPAGAGVVDLSFSQVVQGTMAGPAPWLDLHIADTAVAGTVAVTVDTSFQNSLSPPQTLTGLWLNIPSVAAGVGSLSITDTDGDGSGQTPQALSGTGSGSASGFSATQSLVPSGTTASVVGRYNVLLRFQNNAGNAFQDHESETFNLVGNGLNANAFLATSAQTAGGLPQSPLYALASVTNAGGTSGSGIAFLAALPVPEPRSTLLLLAGLATLGAGLRGRRLA